MQEDLCSIKDLDRVIDKGDIMEKFHHNLMLDGQKIALHTAPKSGSTSSKAILLRLLGDTSVFTHEFPWWPHNKIPNKPFEPIYDAKYRIGFLRDPVARFVSGYCDIAIFREKAKGQPSITEFINNFDVYNVNSSINHHFAPQVEYLGDDVDYYTHLYTPSTIHDFRKLLEDISGRETEDLHLKAQRDIPKPKLTKEQELWIKNRYAIDYQIYGEQM